MTVLRPLLTFFLYAILAVAAQNAIFTRALGVSRLVKMVEDGSVELLKFGLLLTLIQLLSSVPGYYANRLLMGSSFAYKAAFQPVVLVLCSILAFFIVLLGIVLLGGKIAAKDYVELLPIATFNCCVLGTLLLTTPAVTPCCRPLPSRWAVRWDMCWRCWWSMRDSARFKAAACPLRSAVCRSP